MATEAVGAMEAQPLSFLDRVIKTTPGPSRLDMCIQCGTCGGSCPSGADMDHTPRQIFAMIRADMVEETLRSNTPWMCVSCYYCMVRCPQDVHITDIMYTLKAIPVQAGMYDDLSGADLSKSFVNYVEEYGRSFEFGLATRQNLRHQPLKAFSHVQMGLGMLTKGRLDLTPHKIENIEQLQTILNRARELAEAKL